MAKVYFKKMFLILLCGIALSMYGCGSRVVIENNVDADRNEPNEIKESGDIPYYYNPDAFSVTQRDDDGFRMLKEVDNIRPDLGLPLETENIKDQLKVYMYLQDNIPIFIIQDQQGQYQFQGAKDVSTDTSDYINQEIYMGYFDLTGDGKQELVITYPRNNESPATAHMGIMIIDLETHTEIKAFQDGKDWTNFTPEQAQQINNIISEWNSVNNDFSWYEPLQGTFSENGMELQYFYPTPCQFADKDELVVDILFNPTPDDPVFMKVKLQYKDGRFQVDDMSVISWYKYDIMYKEMIND